MANRYVNGSGSAYAGRYGTYGVGSDTTGDGTLATPWATHDKAVASATAGDTVYSAAGVYTENEASLHCFRITKALTFVADGVVKIVANAAGTRTAYNSSSNVQITGVELNNNGVQASVLDVGTNLTNVKFVDCDFIGGANLTRAFNWNTNSVAEFNNSDFVITTGALFYGDVNLVDIINGSSIVASHSNHLFYKTVASVGLNRVLNSAIQATPASNSVDIINSRPGVWELSGNDIDILAANRSLFTAYNATGSGSLEVSDNDINSLNASYLIDVRYGTWNVKFTSNDVSDLSTARSTPLVNIVNQPTVSVGLNEIVLATADRHDVIVITSTGTAGDVDVSGNTIHAYANQGHVIQIGQETASAGDGALNGAVCDGNAVYGPYYADGEAADATLHGVLVGFAVDAAVTRNRVVGCGYGVIAKSSGMSNTSGYIFANVCLDNSSGIRIKGVAAAKIVGNACVASERAGATALEITDNDGVGNANGTTNIGNVYCALGVGNFVGSLIGTVSFSLTKNNAYITDSLSKFRIDGVTKTWAEWVSETGEVASFCIVKNGSVWDVYTSAAPTVAAWSLSACPIDTATGRIVNMVGNPLLKRGAVVTGVNDGGELDIWGNATPASGLNIGADQYDYAPGFGPWSPFDSTMPALSLASTCPGKLKQVQEWRKLASAKEIGKY